MKSGFLIFICFFSSTINAAGAWTGYGEVDGLYIHSTNEGAFVKRGTVLNPDNCPNNDWYFLQKSNKNYNEVYSFLLAASASKQHIRVWIGGFSTVKGRPLLEHVMNKM